MTRPQPELLPRAPTRRRRDPRRRERALLVAAALAIAALVATSGCAPVPVWARGAALRPAMAPPGATAGAAFASHARDVRSAALRPATGGGATCGCN